MVINRAILPGYDPGDNGPFWGAITMWSYNVTNFGRPGNRFFRNIFQMDQTGQPVPVFGGQWYDQDKSPNPMSPDYTRWGGSDNNIFWGRAGASVANSPSFPGKQSLAQWQQQRNTSLPPDQHSQVADPLFTNPVTGDYSLQPASPALALGFQPLPKIAAPTLSADDWHPSADLPPPLPPPPPTAGPGLYNEAWTEPSIEPGVTESMNVGPGGTMQLLTVNGSMPLGNGDLTASVFPELESGAITLWFSKQDALADSSLPFKLGQLSLQLTPNPWGPDSTYFRQRLDLPTATVQILAGGSGANDYKALFEAWIDSETNVAHLTAAAGPAARGQKFTATVRLTSLHNMSRHGWGVSNPVRCSGAPIPYPPDVLVPPDVTQSGWIGIYHRNRANSTLLNSVLDEQGLSMLKGSPADPRRHGVQLANRTFGVAVGGAGFSRDLASDTANSSVLSSAPRAQGTWHVAAAALTSTDSVAQWTAAAVKLLAGGRSNGVWLPAGRDRVRTTKHWERFWARSHIDILRAPMPASVFPSASPEATGFAVSQRYALARYTHAVQQRPLANFSMPIKFNGQAFTAQRPNHNASAPCALAYDGCVEYRQWGPYNYWQVRIQ